MSRMGIFTTLQSMGSIVGLGDPASDFAASCKSNCASMSADDLSAAGYSDVSQCNAYCDSFTTACVTCAPQCAQYRQDSNDWLYCIQGCHGLPSSKSYDDAQKSQCASQGKTYSWIEGCVDTAAYNSCPKGTIYASYPDGKRCIGINTDLTKTDCPAGTALKSVPSATGVPGVACVSPVKPTTGGGTTTPKKTIASIFGGGGGGTGVSTAGMSTGVLLMGLGAVAIIGIILLKKKRPAAVPNRRRRHRRR